MNREAALRAEAERLKAAEEAVPFWGLLKRLIGPHVPSAAESATALDDLPEEAEAAPEDMPHAEVEAVTPPQGAVTFLMTDIVKGTLKWERSREAMRQAVLVFYRAVRENAGAGFLFEHQDAFGLAFARPEQAVAAAIAIHTALNHAEWPPEIGKFQVRMGIHTGEPDLYDGKYAGLELIRAVRLTNLAHPDQVLLSETTEERLHGQLDPDALKDLRQHHLTGLEGTLRLFQLCAPPALPDRAFPSLASLYSHNLPAALLSDFIGRESLVERILRLFARQKPRLVTLDGMGGAGKTRLAVEVGRRIMESPPDFFLSDLFPNGVRFVTFENLKPEEAQDRHLVWEAVARQLLPPEESVLPGAGSLTPMQSCRQAIAAFLEGKAMLVILDNCEHLNPENLADSVAAAPPDIRFLATSRHPLELPGEHVVPVDQMEAPDLDGPPELLWNNEAVQLFISRAEMDGVRLREKADDPATARGVGELCLKLECIPLAIVLAASRMNYHQTLESLCAHLNDRFAELKGGYVTEHPRQRTLLAAIQWSYDLLDPEEKRLLEVLERFRGDWTPAAVRDICAPELPAADAINERLFEEHLIVRRPTETGQLRFCFLDSIRQFLAGLSDPPPVEPVIERRFCDYFLRLLMRAIGPPADSAALDAELRNILAALEAVADRDRELAAKAVQAIERALPALNRPHDAAQFRAVLPFAHACKQLVDRSRAEGWEIVLNPNRWLKKLHRGIEIQHILSGSNRWEAMFGDKEPDYADVTRAGYEVLRRQDDKEWKDEARSTILVLANVPAEEKPTARLLFAAMYFVAHDWWEAYLAKGALSVELLRLWKRYVGKSDDLLSLLEAFSDAYPHDSEWRDREKRVEEWKTVERCMRDIQTTLNVSEPWEELVSPIQRYLRGITDRYLAEAWGHLAVGSCDPPLQKEGNLAWEERYQASKEIFAVNEDIFNEQWSMLDLADVYLMAGRDSEALAECFALLESEQEEVRRSEEAQPGTDLDIEMLVNAYRIIADVHQRRDKAAEAAQCACAALFLAYLFLRTEQDDYALTLYQEQVERMDARLSGLRVQSEAGFAAACQSAWKFWNPASAPSDAPKFASFTTSADWNGVLYPAPPEVEEIAEENGRYLTAVTDTLKRLYATNREADRAVMPRYFLTFLDLLYEAYTDEPPDSGAPDDQ